MCRKRCANAWLNGELGTLTKLKLIITFGNEALQYFEPEGLVGHLHGTAFDRGRFKMFVMYHPSAALRDSRINKRVFADAMNLASLIKEMKL